MPFSSVITPLIDVNNIECNICNRFHTMLCTCRNLYIIKRSENCYFYHDKFQFIISRNTIWYTALHISVLVEIYNWFLINFYSYHKPLTVTKFNTIALNGSVKLEYCFKIVVNVISTAETTSMKFTLSDQPANRRHWGSISQNNKSIS